MPIEGRDYIVRFVPFPNGSAKACVSVDENGFYSIYIDERLSDLERYAAYRHEIDHIRNDDFYNSKTIEEVENL